MQSFDDMRASEEDFPDASLAMLEHSQPTPRPNVILTPVWSCPLSRHDHAGRSFGACPGRERVACW